VRLSLTAWDDDADGATFRSLLQWMATDTRSPEAIQNYATEQVAAPMAEAPAHPGLSGASPRAPATPPVSPGRTLFTRTAAGR